MKMGYYSKVAFAMKTKDLPMLVARQRVLIEELVDEKAAAKTLLEDYRLLYLENAKYPASDDTDFWYKMSADGETCAFGWNNIKWYEGEKGFEDITALMCAWRELFFGSKERPGQWCRIGEDWEDVEFDASFMPIDDCIIYPETRIAVSGV